MTTVTCPTLTGMYYDMSSREVRDYVGGFKVNVEGERHGTSLQVYPHLEDYLSLLGVAVLRCPLTGYEGCVEHIEFRAPVDLVRAAPRLPR